MLSVPPCAGNSPVSTSSTQTLPPWRHVQEQRQLFRKLRQQTIAQFMDCLQSVGIPCVTVRHGVAALWQDPWDQCGSLVVHAYEIATREFPDAPLIPRLALGRDFFHFTQAALKKLRLPAVAQFSTPAHLSSRLEVTVLPTELLEAVSWTAQWAIARHGRCGGSLDPDVYAAAESDLLNLPFTPDRESEDWGKADYLWSERAAQRYGEWVQKLRECRERRRRLLERSSSCQPA